MEQLKFNGKTVTTGKQRSYQEPEVILYKLLGSSPPVSVQERIGRSGKSSFYVQASVLKKAVQGRVLRDGRRTRTRRFRSRYSGYGSTLPRALKQLEKNMMTEFKALAKLHGYELEG